MLAQPCKATVATLTTASYKLVFTLTPSKPNRCVSFLPSSMYFVPTSAACSPVPDFFLTVTQSQRMLCFRFVPSLALAVPNLPRCVVSSRHPLPPVAKRKPLPHLSCARSPVWEHETLFMQWFASFSRTPLLTRVTHHPPPSHHLRTPCARSLRSGTHRGIPALACPPGTPRYSGVVPP